MGDAFKNSCIEATNKKDDTNKFINDNQIVLTEKAAANPNEVGITSPNKASLALVWEFNGKRLLLGGDAIASQLYEAIKKHYDGNHILFEAIKIPHHGSKNNMSNELSY